MKTFFKEHWEKFIFSIAIIFLIHTWQTSGALKSNIEEAQKKYKKIVKQLDNQTKEPVDDNPLENLHINKKISKYFEKSASGRYAIPTSPSAGFENLASVELQENETIDVNLVFKEDDIRRAFKNLRSPDIAIQVAPKNIVSYKILGPRTLQLSGLKFGNATLVFKDKTLKGATMKIKVLQSIKIKGWYPKNSLSAKGDEQNLDLVNVSWKKGLISHPELGGVQTYTLKRQDLNDETERETWKTIKTWAANEAPLEYQDEEVELGGRYRYSLEIVFWVKPSTALGETIYQQNPNFPLGKGFEVTAKNTRQEYAPSQIVAINSGIELLGFIGVQDPGAIDDKLKNRIAQCAIKKWHNKKWVAAWFPLDALIKRERGWLLPRDALKKGKFPLVGKAINYFKDPTQDNKKIKIDFKTDYLLYNIFSHEKGEEIISKKYTSPEEINRISDNGETYREDILSFWIVKKDDPYFTNPKIPSPQSKRVLHSKKFLQKTVLEINEEARESLIEESESEDLSEDPQGAEENIKSNLEQEGETIK